MLPKKARERSRYFSFPSAGHSVAGSLFPSSPVGQPQLGCVSSCCHIYQHAARSFLFQLQLTGVVMFSMESIKPDSIGSIS
jgi:hypothetical protein